MPNLRYDPADWLEKDKLDKHHRERAYKGMSFYDWINADQFIAQVIIDTCQRHLDHRSGHPGTLTDDEWAGILESMRAGFQQYIDNENDASGLPSQRDYSKYDHAMQLFAQWHPNLWD